MNDKPIILKRPELRRYLVPINTAATQQLFTDCLIIGAGVAGLRAAIETASRGCEVVLVCKRTLEDSNTWNAQGGIASVLGSDDTFASHIEDTLTTGCSINDRNTVEQVVKDGPELVRELLKWGAEFDKQKDGSIAITFEGGHSHARVAHALGDNTGKAIAQALLNKVRQFDNITIVENYYTIDLITNDEAGCIGVIGEKAKGAMEIIWAKTTILATGGAGRLFRETTNPEVATADGHAMAIRAGALMRKLMKKADAISENLDKTLAEVKKLTENVNGVVTDNKSRIENIAGNLEQTSANFKEFSEDLKHHPWKLLSKK